MQLTNISIRRPLFMLMVISGLLVGMIEFAALDSLRLNPPPRPRGPGEIPGTQTHDARILPRHPQTIQG